MLQENLIASEIRYRRIFESAKDGILILDAETGVILDVNPFLIDLLEFPLEQVIGKAIWDIGFFKDIAANQDKFSELQQKRYVRYENLPLETSDGRKINVEFVSNVYMEGNNKVIQCNIRDITERKLTEAALRNIHWRMETIIGATQIGTWEWNIPTGETTFNEEWATMIGYTLDELMPTNINTWAKFVHPDDLKESYKQIERHFSGETAYYDCECRMKHKNGSWVWVLDHGCITRTSEGYPYLFFGAHSNITERKKSDEVIAQKNEALQKLNAEKDKFFAIIAHDLKSPFNGFLGLTQLMVEDLSSLTPVEIQKIALSLRKSATNLYGLLGNLLEWSCLQRGVTGYEPSKMLLLLKISESLPAVLESAIKKQINILFSIPEHILVMADANMLASIMRNLVSNAVKFTPKGGVVTISALQVENNLVEISVKDTGIGMSKNLLDNLFCLDEQTNRKGTEGEPSTGLGLILCQGFIEKHGGRLWAESEEGKGSTFHFTLPAGI